MSSKRISRNAPCPCGSGKKYKHCCLGKDFDWNEDDDGTIYRSIPISDEMMELLEDHRQAFVEKHGREPGPDDLIFEDMPPLEHVEHQMIEAMKQAGIDPAIIYAVEQTGRLVTEENQHLLSDVELAEWDAAVEEYEMSHAVAEGPPEYPIGTRRALRPQRQDDDENRCWRHPQRRRGSDHRKMGGNGYDAKSKSAKGN